MSRRILITGTSIPGNTAARWLSRAGIGVTVVERAPASRDGEQDIDGRGWRHEVLRRTAWLHDSKVRAGLEDRFAGREFSA